jgi:hypothetical protein
MDAQSPDPATPTNAFVSSEHESVPGIANGSMATLTEAMQRLASAMAGNPEQVDVPAHSKVLDSAAKHLLAAAAMIEHRSLRKLGKGKGKVPDKITPDMAVKHGVGLGSISPIGIANLFSRFNQLDTDESSSLSIPEIERCGDPPPWRGALPSSGPGCDPRSACLCSAAPLAARLRLYLTPV